MKKNSPVLPVAENLRRKAENIVAKKAQKIDSQLSESELRKLIFELEVHKIELELQNEELERSFSETQDAINLYDFVPVGCYTITRDGKIVRVNNNGITILDKNILSIIDQSFSSFVTQDSRPAFNQFLDGLFKNKSKSSCEVALLSDSNKQIFVHLSGNISENTDECVIAAVDITERRQSEAALAQTRQNYETFFNTIDDLLLILDEQGNIIHCNKTVFDRLGYTEDELNGKSVLMVHPPERREEAGRIVNEMLKGKTEFCPIPLMTKSGIQIPVETRVSNGYWDGKPVIFVVAKDISQVRLSEEKYAKLFHNNHSACGLDEFETGRYIEVNDAFYTLFGFTREEVIGKSALELGILTPESAEDLLNRVGGKDKVSNIEARLRAKNGDSKHVLLSGENINIQDKKYRYTIVDEITERKQAEESLRESEEMYKTLFENTGTSIIIVEEDSTISLVNNRFLHITGYTKEEVEGVKKWTEIVYKDDIGWMTEQHRLRRENPQHSIPSLFEFRYNTKSGELRYVLINVQLIPGTRKSMASLMDITERKQIEKELVRSEALFELFFSQSYMGFYFMMIDKPFVWDSTTDKEKTLETVFKDMKFTKVNQAFLDQYHATETDFIGKTLNDQFKDNPEHGRKVWTDFLDKGKKIRMETNEFTIDGKPVIIEGDYMCMYDEKGRVFGIFGVQLDITASKKAVSDLNESKANLDAVFNATDESVMLLAADNTIIAMNDEAAQRLGNKRDILIGQKLEALMLPDTVKKRHPFIEKAMSTGEPVSFEDERNGRWMSNHLYPILDSGGQTVRMAIFSRDITLRKQAEEALKESELRYKSLFETSPSGIFVFDEMGTILEANKAIAKTTLYTQNELTGSNLANIAMPGQAHSIDENIQRMLAGEVLEHEIQARRKDGTSCDLIVREASFTLPNGKRGILSVSNDITERKQAEEALQVSESKFRAIIENSSDAIGVYVNGKWEVCNPAALRMFGFTSSEELIGTSILGVIAADERQRIRDFVRNRVVEADAPVVYLTRGLRTDGTEFDMDVTLSSFTLENQLHVLVLLRDITEKKREEDLLRENETRFRNIADTAPVMIWITGSDSICSYVNKPWLDFTGRTFEEELGASWAKAIHPEDFQHCTDIFQDAFKTQSNYTLEYRLPGLTGNIGGCWKMGYPGLQRMEPF